MKHIAKNICLWLLLPLLFASCAEKDFSSVSNVPDGMAQIQLGVRIPAPAVTRAMADNENAVIEDLQNGVGFVVFAFEPAESPNEESTLLWVLKSGDTNVESNLSAYTGTSAIRWREGSFPSGYEQTADDAQYGTLYIEAPEYTDGAVELLVLANVDLSVVTTSYSTDGSISSYTLGNSYLLTTSSTFSEVEAALTAFDYSARTLTGTYGPDTDTWNENGERTDGSEIGTETSNYIPMIGLTTLSSGVQLGSTAAVSLRRSLAKITVEVDFSSAQLARFLPRELKIMNVNEYAAVYAPSDENGDALTNIPDNDSTYTAMTTFAYLPQSVTSLEEALSVSAQLYVPETLTWQTEGDRETHLCVLVGGAFDSNGIYDEEGNLTLVNYEENWKDLYPSFSSPYVWYRFDFIPSDATTTEEELTEIIRNHHYRFSISDLAYLGSYTEAAALAMEYPDNYVISSSVGGGNWTLYVEDEDINSITVAYESASDNSDVGVNDYVGVSATELTIELPALSEDFTGNDAIHLKMVTNYEDWTPSNGIDLWNCSGVFSFSFDEDEDTNTNVYWHDETGDYEDEYPAHSGNLWIWADGLSGDPVGNVTTAAQSLYTGGTLDETLEGNQYVGGTLNVNQYYTFYICVGVVRKEIHIYPVVAE